MFQKRIVCGFYHKSEDVEYLQGDTKRLHAFMLRAAIRRMIVCWRFNGGNWYFQTLMPILKKTDNNLLCLHWAEIRQPQMASCCKISFIFVFDFLSPCNSYFARLEQTRDSQQEGAEGGQQREQPTSKYANKDFLNTFTFLFLTLCLCRSPISICLMTDSNCKKRLAFFRNIS